MRAEEDLERVWKVVARIPKGRVATYGQVARLAGLHRNARRAGYAMRALPEGRRIPWHRVVNASGAISPRRDRSSEATQRELLAREGVALGASGRIDLERYRWSAGL